MVKKKKKKEQKRRLASSLAADSDCNGRGICSQSCTPRMQVTVLSRSEAKKEQALAMGADHYLVSSDAAAMAAAEGSLQGIIGDRYVACLCCLWLPFCSPSSPPLMLYD